MNEVKRWEPENTIVGYNMRPDPEGSFVLYDHYAKLEAEAKALREQNTKYHAVCGVLLRNLTC